MQISVLMSTTWQVNCRNSNQLRRPAHRGKARRYTLVFASTLIFILAGCYAPQSSIVEGTPPPFSCARLTESYWAEFRFGVDSPDDVVSAAARLWEIERDRVHVRLALDGDLVGDEVFDVRWWSDANTGTANVYQAWFGEDQTLARIEVEWGHPRPTLAQAIDCLGFPEQYIAYYDQGADLTLLRLVLLYTESGIAVSYLNNYILFTPPANHAGLPMDRFVVVAPDAAEEMVSDLYSHRPDKSAYVLSLCLIKPWPGSIEAMETATKEEQRRCRVRAVSGKIRPGLV